MKSYWVSFWVTDPAQFEYHGPWWVSGSRENSEGRDESAFCAAVRAEDEADAERILRAAFDPGHAPSEWRFTTERGPEWDPLKQGSRFEAADWMQWPWPAVTP